VSLESNHNKRPECTEDPFALWSIYLKVMTTPLKYLECVQTSDYPLPPDALHLSRYKLSLSYAPSFLSLDFLSLDTLSTMVCTTRLIRSEFEAPDFFDQFGTTKRIVEQQMMQVL
jgi:hypothetical protein